MSQSNKSFVSRAKEILTEQKVKVSTSQLYELFSKLSGEANWNVASKKQVEFDKVIFPQNCSVIFKKTYYKVSKDVNNIVFETTDSQTFYIDEKPVESSRTQPHEFLFDSREEAEDFVNNEIKRVEKFTERLAGSSNSSPLKIPLNNLLDLTHKAYKEEWKIVEIEILVSAK